MYKKSNLVTMKHFFFGTAILSIFAVSSKTSAQTAKVATVQPIVRYQQMPMLAENSGMIWWNNLLWQHNDSGGEPAIYASDTASNIIQRRIGLKGGFNIDWEDIAQDEEFIYVADAGNNINGARPKFMVYKIDKSMIVDSPRNLTIQPELITFKYEDMPEKPVPVEANSTDWDCEAMIAYRNKLYLFTKQWKGNKTVVYELSKEAGMQTAKRRDSLDVGGLITGADVHTGSGRLVLSGYTKAGQRFLYMFNNFKGDNFFSGQKRKIWLAGPAQTESVAFINEKLLFIGSEAISVLKQKLETLAVDTLFIKSK
jgi:hypothetical protein